MTTTSNQQVAAVNQVEWTVPTQQEFPRRYESPDAALYVKDKVCGYRKAVQADVLNAAQKVLRDRIPGTEVLSTLSAVKD